MCSIRFVVFKLHVYRWWERFVCAMIYLWMFVVVVGVMHIVIFFIFYIHIHIYLYINTLWIAVCFLGGIIENWDVAIVCVCMHEVSCAAIWSNQVAASSSLKTGHIINIGGEGFLVADSVLLVIAGLVSPQL